MSFQVVFTGCWAGEPRSGVGVLDLLMLRFSQYEVEVVSESVLFPPALVEVQYRNSSDGRIT